MRLWFSLVLTITFTSLSFALAVPHHPRNPRSLVTFRNELSISHDRSIHLTRRFSIFQLITDGLANWLTDIVNDRFLRSVPATLTEQLRKSVPTSFGDCVNGGGAGRAPGNCT